MFLVLHIQIMSYDGIVEKVDCIDKFETRQEAEECIDEYRKIVLKWQIKFNEYCKEFILEIKKTHRLYSNNMQGWKDFLKNEFNMDYYSGTITEFLRDINLISRIQYHKNYSPPKFNSIYPNELHILKV